MTKAKTEADRKAPQGGSRQSEGGGNRQANHDKSGKDALSHTKHGGTEGAGGGKKQERKH